MASSTIKRSPMINGYSAYGSKKSYDVGIARTTKTWTLSSAKTVTTSLVSLGTMSLEAGTWILNGYVAFPSGSRGGRTVQITNSGVNGTQWITQVGGNYTSHVCYFNVLVLSATTTITIYARQTGQTSLSVSEAYFRAVKL